MVKIVRVEKHCATWPTIEWLDNFFKEVDVARSKAQVIMEWDWREKDVLVKLEWTETVSD